jgi:hypothetical protein
MKYVIINTNGVMEIREDSYVMPQNAIQINDPQESQLTSGEYIIQNGQIVINPNPPRIL